MCIKTSSLLKAFAIIILFQCLLACDSEQNQAASQQTNQPWELSQLGEKQRFVITLSCLAKPYVGDFQVCNILLKQGDQSFNGATISIDGGMKTHGHGLPTSPKLTETDIAGQYKIEGLKFSMPGKWVLGFRVSGNQLSDQIIFDFSI